MPLFLKTLMKKRVFCIQLNVYVVMLQAVSAVDVGSAVYISPSGLMTHLHYHISLSQTSGIISRMVEIEDAQTPREHPVVPFCIKVNPIAADDFPEHYFNFAAYNEGHPWIVDNIVALDKPLDFAVISLFKHFSAMNKLKKMALRV
ncbi:calcium-dependent protein kinase 12 [Artemisia annua]|uniref:Calcium-dependent protein kinase 12 n=1 Tax=Artemisia annua TaxID=35608 RepID=A0A2U1LLT1_ARTAN|nr:calcium-dependent protein kinase 12 [Artemisia annua]